MPEVVQECLTANMSTIISTGISIAVGALVTWIAARFYYRKAGKELCEETARLRKSVHLVLKWLEAKGEDVSIIRSDDGDLTGLRHDASADSVASASGTMDADIVRATKGDTERQS